VGAAEHNCCDLRLADDGCIAQTEYAAGEPGGVQRWFGRVFELASSQDDGGQVGVSGDQAFLKEAILQLELDLSTEIL